MLDLRSNSTKYKEVETFADLSNIQDPTRYQTKYILVKQDTGYPLINRKRAGLYRYVVAPNNANYWEYIGKTPKQIQAYILNKEPSFIALMSEYKAIEKLGDATIDEVRGKLIAYTQSNGSVLYRFYSIPYDPTKDIFYSDRACTQPIIARA